MKNAVAMVPSLQTKRLILRGHRLEDFPNSAAMWADPDVTRHILDQPLTEEGAWARFLRYIGHWAVLGFGYWVIEEKQTGRFIGEVGFADYRRNIDPALNGVPEIGWVLVSEVHGKGYATEAVGALTAWADARFGTQTICIIAPENTQSVRAAIKCGIPRATLHSLSRTTCSYIRARTWRPATREYLIYPQKLRIYDGKQRPKSRSNLGDPCMRISPRSSAQTRLVSLRRKRSQIWLSAVTRRLGFPVCPSETCNR